MQKYNVIVSSNATTDLDEIADYIASIYRPETGHKFVDSLERTEGPDCGVRSVVAVIYSTASYQASIGQHCHAPD